MILRKIIAYTILPLIMLFIGVIGIVNPEKVNKSRWISKPFSFKILNKNENTIRTATIVNCICLLIEGIIYSIISIMLWLLLSCSFIPSRIVFDCFKYSIFFCLLKY